MTDINILPANFSHRFERLPGRQLMLQLEGMTIPVSVMDFQMRHVPTGDKFFMTTWTYAFVWRGQLVASGDVGINPNEIANGELILTDIKRKLEPILKGLKI